MTNRQLMALLVALSFVMLSCSSTTTDIAEGAMSEEASSTGGGSSTSAENLLIVNADPGWEADCAESTCASTVTIMDATGATLGSIDFEGYASVGFAYVYRGNAVITEFNEDPGFALHVLNTETATSTKIVDFASFADIRLLSRLRDDSPWYVLTPMRGTEETLLLTDLRSSEIHRFEATVPARSETHPPYSPYSFDATEEHVAVEFTGGRIDIYETATMQAVAQVSVPPGEEMIGLSPDGTQIATRPTDPASSSQVRIHNLGSGESSTAGGLGQPVGWYSDDRILMVDETSASLLTFGSGEASDPVPSMRSQHSAMPATTRWHVAELGEQVVLSDIETGEQRTVDSQDDDPSVDYAITFSHQMSTAWAFLGGKNGAQTLGVVFLDLDSGTIEVYRDRDYRGLVDDITTRVSRDGRSAIVPGYREAGHLLRGGEIVSTPLGPLSFCSDGAVAFEGRTPGPGPGRDAAYFPSIDAAVGFDDGLSLGTLPHVTCVS